MWLSLYFTRKSAAAELTAYLPLKAKSSHDSVKAGVLASTLKWITIY